MKLKEFLKDIEGTYGDASSPKWVKTFVERAWRLGRAEGRKFEINKMKRWMNKSEVC